MTVVSGNGDVTPSTLGRCLKQWRAVQRCKQSHVAEKLGVSQGTVSRWENGVQTPNSDERSKLLSLLSARLSSAADRQLARLVRTSALPVHLICDLTHGLLACSPGRARQFRVDLPDLIGVSLWPAATPDIERAEAQLSGLGWYDGVGLVHEGHTRARAGPLVTIREGRFRWTRFRLSDGTFARLVETLSCR